MCMPRRRQVVRQFKAHSESSGTNAKRMTTLNIRCFSRDDVGQIKQEKESGETKRFLTFGRFCLFHEIQKRFIFRSEKSNPFLNIKQINQNC